MCARPGFLKHAAVGYKTPILAHELGHAQEHEARQFPRAEEVLGVAAPVAGAVGGILLARGGRPGWGALAMGAGQLPHLVDEASASIRGYRALRERGATEKELALARKGLLQAFGTYLAPAAGGPVGLGLGTLIGRNVGGATEMVAPGVGLLAGQLVGSAVGQSLYRMFTGSRRKMGVMELEAADDMRREMGVKAEIYAGKRTAPEFYAPPTYFMKGLQKELLKTYLRDPKNIGRIQERGGVVLPERKAA